MSFLESDDGWLGLWSEDSTGLDIQDSSFHHMSGASTDMTEIPENLLPFGFSMLLASTVSTCLLRLLKLPTWKKIYTFTTKAEGNIALHPYMTLYVHAHTGAHKCPVFTTLCSPLLY